MTELREQIIAEIMKLVKPTMVPMDHKPSIDELEKILNSEKVPKIHMQPDGSISTEKPHTVGDIADAILLIVEPLVEASASAKSWLDNWGKHIGTCPDGQVCTCGLDAIRYELAVALQPLT